MAMRRAAAAVFDVASRRGFGVAGFKKSAPMGLATQRVTDVIGLPRNSTGSSDGTQSPDATTVAPAAPAPAASTEPPHFRLLLPDMGQASKSGTMLAWRKAEGDFVKSGDIVCEVEMDQFTVGMEIADNKAYVARILVPAGTKDVPINEPLAIFVYDDEHVHEFKNVPRFKGAKADDGGGSEAPQQQQPTGVDVLKFLHKLTKTGAIKDREFAKKLQALARHENKELLRIFEASYEDGERTEENFDLDFFLENAHELIEEESERKPSE